jgi:hypothetical protein
MDSSTRILVFAGGVKVNRTLAWGYFGRRLILVHASGIPADDEWAEFVADSHGDPGEAIVIVASDTKLSPQQRADVQHWRQCYGKPAVLVTDSILTRGVAKALSWYGVKIQAFARRDLDRAFACAGVASNDRSDARALIECMATALDDWRKDALAS